MPQFPFFGRKKKKNEEEETERLGSQVNDKDNFFLGATDHFRWFAESGVQSIRGYEWVRNNGVPYLERAYEVYKNKVLQVGDLPRLPARIIVRASASCQGGIAGSTGNGQLTYCAGEWNSNPYCYGILAHELCNLFTGECVTSGWPIAWWANHRSPFPTMIANEVMKLLAPTYYRMWGNYGDPLVIMFERLYKIYPNMFPRMFQKMRELRVSLSGLSDPFLSQVVYYFMFYGAQRALGKYFVCPPMPEIDLRAFQQLESRYHLGVLSLPPE